MVKFTLYNIISKKKIRFLKFELMCLFCSQSSKQCLNGDIGESVINEKINILFWLVTLFVFMLRK
jgi:hypothetical protein